MALVLFKVKSKHSPPNTVEVRIECRPDTPDQFNAARKLKREGVFSGTSYGWEYIPPEGIDTVEIHEVE